MFRVLYFPLPEDNSALLPCKFRVSYRDYDYDAIIPHNFSARTTSEIL